MDIERLTERIKGLKILRITGDNEKMEFFFRDGTAMKIYALHGFLQVTVGTYEFEEEFTI